MHAICRRRLLPWSLLAVVAVLVLGAQADQPTAATPAARVQAGCPAVAAAGAAAAELGFSEERTAVIEDAFRGCWADMQPQMQAAERDCEQFEALVGEVLEWERAVYLLGLEERFTGELAELYDWQVRALAHCYNAAFDRCVDHRAPTEALVMTEVQRQLALLGGEGAIDLTKFDQCLRFELLFETRLTLEVRTNATLTSHTHARVRVPLRFDGTTGSLTGTGPLEVVSRTVTQPGVAWTVGSPTDLRDVEVVALTLDLAGLTEGNPKVSLRFYPGSFATPTRNPHHAVAPFTAWSWGYGLFYHLRSAQAHQLGADRFGQVGGLSHEELQTAHEGGRVVITLDDWTYVRGEAIARKRISQTFTGVPQSVRTEDTTFELRHTPVR